MRNRWKVLMVSEENSFITASLTDHLRKWEVESDVTILSVQTIAEKQGEDWDAVILFLQDIAEITQPLIYLKDMLEEKSIPVFEVFAKESGVLPIMLPNVAIVFQRPIMVAEMAKRIHNYLLNHDRHQQKKILVVDDSGIMLRSIKEWLEGKYQVALANSGAMAMKYLALHRPDLILLDYEMPVVNGAQVLAMIRSECELSSIPVIFLTGKNDRATVMEVQKYKIQGYILKSENPQRVIELIDQFFSS